MVETHKKRKIQ